MNGVQCDQCGTLSTSRDTYRSWFWIRDGAGYRDFCSAHCVHVWLAETARPAVCATCGGERRVRAGEYAPWPDPIHPGQPAEVWKPCPDCSTPEGDQKSVSSGSETVQEEET